MFCFGHPDSAPLTTERAESILAGCRARQHQLATTPLETIFSVLERLSDLWAEDSEWFTRALDALEQEIGFSRPMIRHTLLQLPGLLRRSELSLRVVRELGARELLDDYHRPAGFPGRLRAYPLGTLLHVTAGNVFLGGIDSLVMGLITKNISIMRVSSRNQSFPALFAESLVQADPDGVLADKFCVVHWPADNKAIEELFKQGVDAILAWGGQTMLDSYSRGLPTGVRLVDFGPKISIQVIFADQLHRSDVDDVGQRVARDVCMWDQSACASPQDLFWQHGIDVDRLLASVAAGFRAYPMPRGPLSDDEAVEVLKERYRGKVSRLLAGGNEVVGTDFYLHADPQPGLRPSPLQRTLILKQFSDLDDLVEQLRPGRAYLQSCSYLTRGKQKQQLLDRLGALGVHRFTRLGEITEGLTGAPHDGRHVLRELVSLVVDEAVPDAVDIIDEAAAHVPRMREALAGTGVDQVSDAPLMSSATILDHPLPESRALLDERAQEGIIFASSGTSGSPKLVWYSPAELDDIADMLAFAFSTQGLAPGAMVANLFSAGNLWASFLAVHKALEKCGVVQLPIGALSDRAAVVGYLAKFQPRAVFGMPSLLAEYAQWSLDHKTELRISEVYYAGEHLTRPARAMIERAWGGPSFHSAGYASVDAGPIGYPCRHCGEGEHHLFSRHVHLEVIDGEAVVTSTVRRTMPIIRYRTGDRIDVNIPQECACGSTDTKFVLRGRVDGQINIWASRVSIEAIGQSIVDVGIDTPTFQVEIVEDTDAGSPRELLRVLIVSPHGTPEMADELRRRFFARSPDLAATHDLAWVAARMLVEFVSEHEMTRTPGAGKIPLVVDRRKPA